MLANHLKSIQDNIQDNDASSILEAVLNAYKKIKNLREALDHNGHSNQPLYILIGEQHARPAHHLFKVLLMHLLNEDAQKGEHVVFGHELIAPDNYNEPATMKEYLQSFIPWRDQPNDSQKKLSHHFNNTIMVEAPNSHRLTAYNAWLVANNSVVILNNLRHTHDGYIMTTDPETQAAIRDTNINFPERLKYMSPYGNLIRNTHKANSLIRATNDGQARIAVQFAGNMHLNGYAGVFQEEEALSFLYKRKVGSSYKFFLASNTSNSNLHLLKADEYEVIDKLSQYEGPSSEPYVNKQTISSSPQDYEDEITYLKTILHALNVQHMMPPKTTYVLS